MTYKILRRRDVERVTGLSRSTIYDWMRRNQFPKSIALGSRLVGWRESDIAAWLEARTPRVA
jgi:prophage regulatory protein